MVLKAASRRLCAMSGHVFGLSSMGLYVSSIFLDILQNDSEAIWTFNQQPPKTRRR